MYLNLFRSKLRRLFRDGIWHAEAYAGIDGLIENIWSTIFIILLFLTLRLKTRQPVLPCPTNIVTNCNLVFFYLLMNKYLVHRVPFWTFEWMICMDWQYQSVPITNAATPTVLFWSGFWFDIFIPKNYVYCVHKFHNVATTFD